MITKKLKSGNKAITLFLPQKLQEVNLGQLMAMQAATSLNDLEAISILSGAALTDLQNIDDAGQLLELTNTVSSIAHQIKYLYDSEAIPAKVKFKIDGKDRVVRVIKNLSIEPAGAFMASREIIGEEINKHIKQYGEVDWQQNFNPSLNACAQILAQYFYCRATGNCYNEYAAAGFENHVKQLPITDALPIAKYFFLSYPNLSKPKTGFWHRLHRLWSSGRVSKTLSRLSTSTPLTPSATAM